MWIKIAFILASSFYCWDASTTVKPLISKKQYVILAPSVVRPSAGYKFYMALPEDQHFVLPVSFTAELVQKFHNNTEIILAFQAFQKRSGGEEILSFTAVKEPANTLPSSYIFIRITFTNNPSSLPQQALVSAQVPVRGNYYAIIQTDKQIYQQGQTIYMTAFMLDRDLKPHTGENKVFTLTINDAEQNQVGLWTNISSAKSVWANTILIPEIVNYGEWLITLTSASLQAPVKKTVRVEQYEPPRFEVDVTYGYIAGLWLFSSSDAESRQNYRGSITAKYTFGQPVIGTATLTLIKTGGCNSTYDMAMLRRRRQAYTKIVSLKGDKSPEDGVFILENFNDIIAPDKTNEKRILKKESCKLLFDVQVNDTVSLQSVTLRSTTVTIYKYRYKMDFIEPTPGRVLPHDLSYSTMIKITDLSGDDDSAPDVDLDIFALRLTDNSTEFCEVDWAAPSTFDQPKLVTNVKLKTDAGNMTARDATSRRIADSSLRPEIAKIGFKATIKDVDSGEVMGYKCELLNATIDKMVNILLDPSTLTSVPQLGSTVKFRVSAKFAGDVYFVLSSYVTGEVIHLQPKLNFDKLGDDQVWRSAIIQQTIAFDAYALLPRAVAMAWGIDPATGLFHSDFVTFKVAGETRQKVSLTFSDKSGRSSVDANCSTRPKASKWLNVVTTEARSAVVILAMDKRVTLVPKNQRSIYSRDVVMRLLDVADPLANEESCWSCGETVSYPGDNTNRYTDASDLLAAYNILLIVDGTKPNDVQNRGPNELASEDGTKPNGYSLDQEPERATLASDKEVDRVVRRNIPEVWFSLVEETDENGEFYRQMQLPDSLTTFIVSAFAIGDSYGYGTLVLPAEILSSKPFFVDLALPQKRMTMNEEFQVPCIIYNYAGVELSVELELKDVTPNQAAGSMYQVKVDEPGQLWAQNPKVVRTVQVGPRGAASMIIWLKGIQAGPLALRLTGKGTLPANKSLPNQQGNGKCPASSTDVLLIDVVEISDFFIETQGSPGYANANFEIKSFRKVQRSFIENDIFGSQGVPLSIIDGSKMYELGVTGDPLGVVVNTLANVSDFVQQPNGCGEQLMKSLMPNAFVYKYLDAKGQLTNELKSRLMYYTNNYYSRLAAYRLSNGAFSLQLSCGFASAYAGKDVEIWRTAFIVRYLTFCKTFIPSFPALQSDVDATYKWLANQFQSMNGTDNMRIYIYLTFAEANRLDELRYKDMLREIVKKAAFQSQDPFQIALAAYASSHKANDLSELSKVAVERLLLKVKKEGTGTTTTMYWQPISSASLVETAGYVLLALLNNGKEEALYVNNYLLGERNAMGGYFQTQETVVGLHALSEFCAKAKDSPLDLSITAEFTFQRLSNGELITWKTSQDVRVSEHNRTIFQRISPPRQRAGINLTSIELLATGVGTIQCRLTVKYNKMPSFPRGNDNNNTITNLSKNNQMGDNETYTKTGTNVSPATASPNRTEADPMVSVRTHFPMDPVCEDVFIRRCCNAKGLVNMTVVLPSGMVADKERTLQLNGLLPPESPLCRDPRLLKIEFFQENKIINVPYLNTDERLTTAELCVYIGLVRSLAHSVSSYCDNCNSTCDELPVTVPPQTMPIVSLANKPEQCKLLTFVALLMIASVLVIQVLKVM